MRIRRTEGLGVQTAYFAVECTQGASCPLFPRRSRYVHPRSLEAHRFHLAIAVSDVLFQLRRTIADGGPESILAVRVLH